MKLFTSREKRILQFLAALFLLGLLVQQGRHFFSAPGEEERAAREQAYHAFQEGTQRYLASVDTYPESISELAGAPLNINYADEQELQALPGIGPVLAKKIVDYRVKNGYFQSVQNLIEVQGIGPKTLERLIELITVQPIIGGDSSQNRDR